MSHLAHGDIAQLVLLRSCNWARCDYGLVWPHTIVDNKQEWAGRGRGRGRGQKRFKEVKSKRHKVIERVTKTELWDS